MKHYTETYREQFPARIVAAVEDSVTGAWRHAWVELVPGQEDAYAEINGARSGTTTRNYLLELNNRQIAVDTHVWVRHRDEVGGQLHFEAEISESDSVGGGGEVGGTITVREVDGTPSLVTGIVELDASDGLTVTDVEVSFGVHAARITIKDASTTQNGIITTGIQEFGSIAEKQAKVWVGGASGGGFPGGTVCRIAIGQTGYPGDLYTAPDGGVVYVTMQGNGQAAAGMNWCAISARDGVSGNVGIFYVGSDCIALLYGAGVQPRYGIRYLGLGDKLGIYGTDSIGNVFHGGICTTLGTAPIGGGSSYTNEEAQDAVGSILTDSSTIDFAYDDALNTITAVTRQQMSITADSAGLKLDGDATAPGNGKYYGTSGAGVRGWLTLPSGGSSTQALYQFDTDVDVSTDPGAGFLRANSTPGATTQLAFSITTSAGTNISSLFRSLVAGDTVFLQEQATPNKWARYKIVSTAEQASTLWWKFTVTYVAQGDAFPADNASTTVAFTQTGTAGLANATETVAGLVEIATQAEVEAASYGSAGAFAVPPGRMQHHPGVCKGWANFVGSTGTINGSYNVSGITDHGTGDFTVLWNVDMSSGNYAVSVATKYNSDGGPLARAMTEIARNTSNPGTTGTRSRTGFADSATLTDVEMVSVIAFGDQA